MPDERNEHERLIGDVDREKRRYTVLTLVTVALFWFIAMAALVFLTACAAPGGDMTDREAAAVVHMLED